MPAVSRPHWLTLVAVAGLLCAAAGCHTTGPLLSHSSCSPGEPCVDHCRVPKELKKTTMPEYVIEPPDLLLIDAVKLIPLPPYRIEPLDAILINAPGALPTEPIAGLYPVDPDGTVVLGPTYGQVKVAKLTIPEAEKAITEHLKTFLKEPKATVALGQTRGLQQIRGEHLVRPDGSVNLGSYGDVRVVGLTLPQAKKMIELHLSQFLEDPDIALDIVGYNSKVFYVITDGAGFGEQVYRLPITGNETVLDAMSQVGGLSSVASKKRIWIARPAPGDMGCCQTLGVNWKGITQCGDTRTNYQLLPGDRLYVGAAPFVMADSAIARVAAPIEKIFGLSLLGTGAVQTIRQASQGVNSGGNNLFGF